MIDTGAAPSRPEMPEKYVADSRLDIQYLRLVKAAVVLMMTLVLLVVIAALGYAGFQLMQSPAPPVPAKAAPARSVDMKALQQYLLEEQRKKLDEEKARQNGGQYTVPADTPEAKTTLNYLTEANALLVCLDDFSKLSDLRVAPQTDQQKLENLNKLRSEVERLAEDRFRGAAWVTAAVPFVCGVLRDPGLVHMKKEEKVGPVFYPTLRFHAAAWRTIAVERASFEQGERARVASEIAGEESRVALAKAKGYTALITSGSAFVAFMLMALYLIFARIELHLRHLAGSPVAARA